MDPRTVFKQRDLLKFWPTATQSGSERVASTTRFILYATCLLYLLNRNVKVFALGALALAILFYLWNSNMIIDGKVRPTTGDARSPNIFRPEVSLPTLDNPMGNVLLSDYVDNPDRAPAAWYPSVRQEIQKQWSIIHPFERQRDAERNFYTVANTTIPNDQTGFAQAAYGKPFAPKCKDQGGKACDVEGFYSGFPERVQMKPGN